MKRKLALIFALSAMLTFSFSAVADEMISVLPTHGTTPDAHGHAAIASYVNLAVTYAAASDINGNLYTAIGLDLKPVAVSFTLGGKTVHMSFLETSVMVRVSDASVVEGQIRTVNTYSLRVMNSEVSVTDRFTLGLAVVKPLIRDSMQSTAIDWAQLTAAFTIVHTDSQRLVASVAPFVRTNVPYSSTGNATTEQLWLPVKVTYNYRHNRLTFSASTQYIPIMNFTTDALVHAFVFGAGVDYRLTAENHRFDLHIFLDGQIWVQGNSNAFTLRDQMDLSSIVSGLRMNF